MQLEFLQDALRIETRVGIIETSDEAERRCIILAAVDPRTAVLARG